MTGLALGATGAGAGSVPDTLARGKWRVLLGIVLVLHGFAHSNAIIWVNGTLPSWAATLFWAVALLGYLGAGLGLLGVPIVRRLTLSLLATATLASMALLALIGGPWAFVGVAIDVAFLAMVERTLQRIRPGAAPMIAERRSSRWTVVGHSLGLAFLVYATVVVLVHPMYLRWGTTDAERAMPLPGDGVVTDARYRVDHGMTIRAPADSVWPWLVQLGQDRGGFYSYAWLERMIGDDIHNADRIHPEWQTLKAGDLVRATQPDYLGGRFGELGWRVTEIIPGRAIVLENWGAFVLHATDAQTTRFLIRTRGDGAPSVAGVLLGPLSVFVFEPAHFIMQRGMMLGIRDRAEAMMEPRAEGGEP
jgi:hypothetical protein